ncbi:MAG: TerB family tellurite resistance protein [Chloroflexi bacterium]|nr:TerB family tellurite resistance protein [Chloroflexota bacterium]
MGLFKKIKDKLVTDPSETDKTLTSVGSEQSAELSVPDREWGIMEHLTYYFMAYASFADGNYDKEEMSKIFQFLCRWTQPQSKEEAEQLAMPIYNRAEQKFKDDSKASGDDGHIVQKYVDNLIPRLKQETEPDFQAELVKMLVELGNADGDFSDGEKRWVQQLANDLDLDISFEDEEPEIEEVESGTESKDYPNLTFTSNGEDHETIVYEHISKWLIKTEYYCRRAGIGGRFPDSVGEINAVCPQWTDEQIDQIISNISKKKIIPSLTYLPDQFYGFSKQIWWFAPFVIWKEQVASWIFIDKNGIYAAHPGDNEGTLIYPWDSIDYIDIEDISDFDTDEPDNVVKMTVHRNDSDGFLTFCEFVAAGSGSYLKVIEEIFEVFSPVIEASAGEGTWFHGVGKEGYKTFNSPDELLDDSCWEGADFPNPAFFGYVAPEEETLEPQVVETESIVEDEIPEKPIKDEAPADVPVASKKDNAELEVYLNDPKSKYNGPDFKNTRTLIRHIVNDLNSSFPDYRFEYSASMGLSLFGDETGKSKFAGCFIRNKEMVGFDFLRDYENDYRRPKIEGVLVENRRSNQRFIEWYRVFFNSVEQYDENKEKLYSILKSSEKMKMKLSDKLLSKQKFSASDKSKYQKYLDKDYTFELAKEKEKLEPKYIQSTYRDLRNMGFKGYEITYTWDADAEFVDEEMEHWEGSMDCCEIMAPWENISIVKNLFCNDYGLPPDEVDIQEMRELTIDGLVALENFSIGDTITYIAKDDPIYELLDHSTKSVFKGNAPESPDVIQLVTFLYVCVAYLNDGVLSDNEILKMKEKLQASGIEMNDSSKLIIEANAWWEDAVTKEVQFDDMVECVEQLKNNNAWNENVKESLHSHLTAITTADGVIDMKDGTFAAEKKLKVVDSIMKLFDGEGE